MELDTEECKVYLKLIEALFIHYNISKETYQLKMEQLKQKAEETWTMCWKRCKNLVKECLAGCKTVDDMVELLAIDGVTRLMPRPIANHVKN